MSWREAFLRQARAEHVVLRQLDRLGVEYAHRLHYLQMVCEKLAKGFLADPRGHRPPPATHHALVRFLRVLRSQPDWRSLLHGRDAASFRAHIDSLLELAERIERLAPSAAGFEQPNPEYPWRDPQTGEIRVPVDYDFPLFDPRDPRMIKLQRLLEALVRHAA